MLLITPITEGGVVLPSREKHWEEMGASSWWRTSSGRPGVGGGRRCVVCIDEQGNGTATRWVLPARDRGALVPEGCKGDGGLTQWIDSQAAATINRELTGRYR